MNQPIAKAGAGPVLGVETSCDETGVAVFDPARGLLAHTLYSQIRMHADYGGVVPELASRDHVRKLMPLVRETLARAGLGVADLGGVAYTAGPGLVGALLVGATAARALAWSLGLPAIGVHHMEGHLLAPLLEADPPEPPFVALLVSGGHSMLIEVAGIGRYTLLGDTLDDAAGEAFDKTAKLMGLPYPGGPALARLAEQGQPGRFRFARPMTDRPGLDFSFSGLKTAVALRAREASDGGDPAALAPSRKADIAAGFQAAVVDVLVAKALRALDATGLSTLVVAGGVGANRALRERLRDALDARGGRVHFPEPRYCTDNGAMIAMAAALRLGDATRDYAFGVAPRWELRDVTQARATIADNTDLR